MTTLEQTHAVQDGIAEKIKKVQELYADAPEVGRVGLERMMVELKAAAGEGQQKATSAGRTGLRVGKVSELTAIWKFAPGGARRLRIVRHVVRSTRRNRSRRKPTHGADRQAQRRAPLTASLLPKWPSRERSGDQI